MQYFVDTEFIEDGKTIDLVSLAIVAEDGRELYLVSSEFDPEKASEWVRQHVLTNLAGDDGVIPYCTRAEMKQRVLDFVGPEKPRFWSYYGAYDWVAIAQLMGTMMDLPGHWPMYCMDIKQWCVQCGDPQLPPQASTEHNALADARWNRDAYQFLVDLNNQRARDHLVWSLGFEGEDDEPPPAAIPSP